MRDRVGLQKPKGVNMQAQAHTSVEEQVQTVAGRILKRLEHTQASEEESLIAAVSTQVQNVASPDTTAPIRQTRHVKVERKLVKMTLALLGKNGQLRRVKAKSAKRLYFVLSNNATSQDLQAAYLQYLNTQRKTANKALSVSEWEASNLPELGQHSQEEDGCLNYLTKKSGIEGEELPNLNHERFETYKTSPLSAEAQRKVDYQDKIGQGRRNTKRIRHANIQRWLNTPDGRAWQELQRIKDDRLMQESLKEGQVEENPYDGPDSDDDVFATMEGVEETQQVA